MKKSEEDAKLIGLDRKFLVALSYLNILFLVPLAVLGKEGFSSFHIKQGFTLFLVEVLGATLITLLDVVTFGIIAKILTPIFWIFIIFLTCWGILSVLRGRRDKIFMLESLVRWFEL